jgi:hypothetical protein
MFQSDVAAGRRKAECQAKGYQQAGGRQCAQERDQKAISSEDKGPA